MNKNLFIQFNEQSYKTPQGIIIKHDYLSGKWNVILPWERLSRKKVFRLKSECVEYLKRHGYSTRLERL